MYPFIRLALTLRRARKLPPVDFFDTHEMACRCSLLDCDIFGEMNNGRILTLFELGRFEQTVRMGFWQKLRKKGWGFAVAGVSVRYRRRILPLERYTQKTRILGWDERFVYIEQAMVKTNGQVANHALFRTAVVAAGHAVPTQQVAELAGVDPVSPTLPEWVHSWIAADKDRIWPPFGGNH